MKIPIEINRMTEEQKAELCENTASNRMHNRLTNFFQKYWIDFGGHDRIDSPWFAGVSARATNLQGEFHEFFKFIFTIFIPSFAKNLVKLKFLLSLILRFLNYFKGFSEMFNFFFGGLYLLLHNIVTPPTL